MIVGLPAIIVPFPGPRIRIILRGMSQSHTRSRCAVYILVVLGLINVGCESEPRPHSRNPHSEPAQVKEARQDKEAQPASADSAPKQPAQTGQAKKVLLGKNVW